MRATIHAAVMLSIAAGIAGAQQPTAPHSKSYGAAAGRGASAHGAPSDGLKWGPAPAVFPAGAQMAVLQGDPGSSAIFTVRLRMPNGYKIAPHTHPADEYVTVISGTLLIGMGDTAASKGMMRLRAGGFVNAPANQSHYVTAQGRTVVQVTAMGPFALTYGNPADTPK